MDIERSPWVYNPVRKLAPEYVKWLVKHEKDLLKCCSESPERSFSKKALYGNRNINNYLLPSEKQLCGYLQFDEKQPFGGGPLKEVVVFNILNKLLKHNFGFGMKKAKEIKIRIALTDEPSFLSAYPQLLTAREIKEELQINGGPTLTKLHLIRFNAKIIQNLQVASKLITIPTDIVYEPPKKSKRLERATEGLTKKRNRVDDLIT